MSPVCPLSVHFWPDKGPSLSILCSVLCVHERESKKLFPFFFIKPGRASLDRSISGLRLVAKKERRGDEHTPVVRGASVGEPANVLPLITLVAKLLLEDHSGHYTCSVDSYLSVCCNHCGVWTSSPSSCLWVSMTFSGKSKFQRMVKKISTSFSRLDSCSDRNKQLVLDRIYSFEFKVRS